GLRHQQVGRRRAAAIGDRGRRRVHVACGAAGREVAGRGRRRAGELAGGVVGGRGQVRVVGGRRRPGVPRGRLLVVARVERVGGIVVVAVVRRAGGARRGAGRAGGGGLRALPGSGGGCAAARGPDREPGARQHVAMDVVGEADEVAVGVRRLVDETGRVVTERLRGVAVARRVADQPAAVQRVVAVHLAVPGWIDDGDGPGDLTDAVGGGLVPGGQRRVDLPLPAVGVGVGGDAVLAGVVGGLLVNAPGRQHHLGQLRRLASGERVLAGDGGLAERVRVDGG